MSNGNIDLDSLFGTTSSPQDTTTGGSTNMDSLFGTVGTTDDTTRETSWWKGEEGFIPDEFQPWVERSRVKDTVEKQTLIEDILPDNFATDWVADIWRAGKQGWIQGSTVNEAFDVYKQGRDISTEELLNFIEINKKLEEVGPSDEMLQYTKIKDEAGGGVWGFMKGMVITRGQVIPQVIVSSAASMISSFFDSEEAAGIALATSGTTATIGGGTGAALTSWSGPGALFGAGFGATTAAISGFIAGLTGSMETALTLSELLKEELGDKEFNEENVRAILEDEDTFNDIKNRALARGITIGMIEGITAGVSRGVASSMWKAGAKTQRIARRTTAIEMTGGATGEAFGQLAAGQEFDIAKVLMEGVAEAKGIVNVTDILTKKQYSINGEIRTRKEILDIVNDPRTKPEDLAKIKFEIKGDKSLQNLISKKQNDAIFDTQIDERVSDKGDRKRLVELENERRKAKADAEKKGIFKVLDAETRLEAIEKETNEIIDKYKAVDRRTKDVRARKKVAAETFEAVVEKNFQANLEFAKKHSGLYGLTVDDTMTVDQIKKKYGKEAATADGFIDNDNNVIIINKTVAKETDAVNVGNHELLHGILRKAVKEGKINKNLISDLKTKFGENNWSKIEQRIKEAGYTQEYMDQNQDEYITLLSDAIANNEITFDESLFTPIKELLLPIFRAFGFKKINFETAESTYEFLKEYNKSIHKGALSSAIVKATGGKVDAKGVKFAKSNIQGILEEYGGKQATKADLRRMVNETLVKTPQGQETFDITKSRFGLEIEPIVEAITKRLYDKIPSDATRAAGLTRADYKNALVSEAATMTQQEYNPAIQNLDTFISNRLNLRAESLAKRLGVEERILKDIDFVKETDIDVVDEPTPKPKPTIVKEKILLETFGETDLQNEIREDIKIAGIEGVEKYLDFKKELVKHRKFMKDGTEITPELKAKYKEQGKKPPKELKSKRIPTGKYYFILEKVATYYGITDPIRLITEKDLDTKQRKAAQDKILSKRDEHIVSLPEGTTKAGDPTGIANTALGKAFFKAGGRTKFKTTGTGKGLAEQAKQRIEPQAYLNIFGLIPKARVNNTSVDPAIRSQVIQTAVTAVRQAAQQEQKALNLTKEAVDKYRDGKSNIMYSKSYGNKVLKKLKLNEVSNKNANDRAIFKTFVEEILPVFVPIPRLKSGKFRLPSDTYGPRSKIVPGYYMTRFQREISAVKAGNVQLRNKVYTKEQIEQINKAYGVVKFDESQKEIDTRKKGAELFVKGLNEAVNGKKGNKQNLRPIQMLLGSTANGTYHIVRMIAPGLGVTNVGKTVNKEHVLVANNAADIIIESLAKDNVNLALPWLLDNYYQINVNAQQKALIDNAYENSDNKMPPVFYENLNKAIDTRDMSLASDPLIRYTMANINLSEINWHTGGTLLQHIDAKYGFDGALSYGNNSETSVKLVNKALTEFFAKKTDKKQTKKAIENISKIKFSKTIDSSKTLNNAIQMSRSAFDKFQLQKQKGKEFVESIKPQLKQSRGITVLDFDDTLATTKSLVRFTAPDGTTGTLNAEEYASTYQDLLEQGYTFDFSEFNKVVKGKIAPLFQKALKLQKKFGPENMFVLTARPPAAQKAIFDFLKANGLNIPMKNITGLGNSTSEAKALWIAEKVGEGYNDFYFADDALQNVQAVKNMLDQFDVKSKVQQAKVKFSKSIDKDFNNILENVTGIDAKKRFSAVKARKRGEKKGRFRFFIPPSHEDFVGLLYNFIGKGKEGNKHRDFFEEVLVRPLNRAFRELNTARQSIANDYRSLNKQFKDVKKKLNKKTPDGDFTYQDAIRVYLWDKHGYDIPGLSKTDQKVLVDLVMADKQLQVYAETLNIISKRDNYVKPSEGWEVTDIRMDLDDATGRIGRAEFFTEFLENAKIIFSPENLNKIEAIYGPDMVSAIKDMLYRIETGRNRPSGQNKIVNGFMNWFNASVASTMFINVRSVVLQQMSLVNFINYSDNNILAAAKAFANQKQYWTDWAFLFNSDFMKQRRGGIMTDVNGAELADSLKGAKNNPVVLLGKLLQMGFKPTQIGDNVAIATGGAPYYRNRINTYLKQGLSQKEAETKAFVDFQVLAEATQQSARPDMVSQQQASPLGKVILAFQNVTSQFNRLGKKAFLDIKNRRISPEYKNAKNPQLQSDISNLSRIAYYFAIQNLIFYSLQSALFMMMFDDDEDDEKFLKKKERMINGTIDSILRGTGVWGAVVATLKNMAIKRFENEGKDWNANEYSVLVEGLQVSPPLGSRVRKLVKAERDLIWDKKIIDEMETFDIENPLWPAVTNYIEGTTNAPANRTYNLTLQAKDGLNNQFDVLQRVLRIGGWNRWQVGIEEVKKSKKKEKFGDPKKKRARPIW